MTTKALVFDLDGTLYRQAPVRRAMAWRLARHYWWRPSAGWRTARALQAYRRAQEQLRSRPGGEGRPSHQLEEASILARQSVSDVRAAVERWMEQAPLTLVARYLRPGVRELLETARARGLRLAVVSDYPADAKLRAMQLHEAFDEVVTAQDEDVQRFKPDPRGLQVALRRLGVQPGEAVYIGDRANVDGLAATNAGMRSVILGSTGGVHDVMSMAGDFG